MHQPAPQNESRYILAKCIARGGMAEIFLAKQIGKDGFQRICAIKRILPHYAQDSEFVEMFRDEAHICKRLQHANIVRVEGFEEVEGSYAIIMEFVDGSDLRTVLAACEKSNHRLSVPMAVYIIAEAARGLHYAHTKVDEVTNRPLEIVHRDISPQNILVSYEGEVKITDFGIADADNKMNDTKPGVVKGKYSYMSPEQINAKPLDARTDVFSLAIVLWEMLAMKRLFHGENEVMTINLVRECNIDENITEFNPEVDDELERILLKGLEKDRSKRYQSAQEFERRLRVYLSKKFPAFTPSILAILLKDLLAQKRNEVQAEIKKTLTSAKLTPSTKNRVRITHPAHELEEAQASAQPPKSQLSAKNNVVPLHHTKSSIKKIAPTGVRRSPQTQQSPKMRRQRPKPQAMTGRVVRLHKKPNKLKQFLLVLLLVGIGFVAVTTWKEFSGLKPFAQVNIHSVPSTVKIQLDNDFLFNGRYVQTPKSFKIPPGKHQITIFREGYKKKKIDVFAKAQFREKLNFDNIILKANTKFSPTKFFTNKSRNKSTYIVVENGRDQGFLPFTIRDLSYGMNHSIRVYPNYKQDKKDSFTCNIKPFAVNIDRPHLIYIDAKKGSCSTVKK